jgi:tRNA(fMet)-specific endonuclease VapC
VSRYLLDTDTAIEIFRGRNARALSALAANRSQDVALSVVTVAEMVFGAHRSTDTVRSTRFCSAFEILPLTRAGAEIAGRARAHLETAGQRIGPHDVLIVGIALAEARVLVTHNTRELILRARSEVGSSESIRLGLFNCSNSIVTAINEPSYSWRLLRRDLLEKPV